MSHLSHFTDMGRSLHYSDCCQRWVTFQTLSIVPDFVFIVAILSGAGLRKLDIPSSWKQQLEPGLELFWGLA